MKKIFINSIVEQNGVTHGMAVVDKTIKENFQIVYTEGQIRGLAGYMQQNNGTVPFYSFDRFCQYIIYLQFQPFGVGFSMKITDFKNDIDLALGEYSELKEKGWLQSDRDKIMQIFQEIQKDPESVAEMVLKDPFP